jgi:hypothetical protein
MAQAATVPAWIQREYVFSGAVLTAWLGLKGEISEIRPEASGRFRITTREDGSADDES